MILKFLPGMKALLEEPALSTDGFTDEVAAETVVETRLFLHDAENEDSDVIFSRTVVRNDARDILSSTVWSVTNAITITGIVSDQDNDETISLTEETELTIAGTNFGATDDDIVVVVKTLQHTDFPYYYTSAHSNMAIFGATLVSVEDEEIVATVTLTKVPGLKSPIAGACTVQVLNKTRHLASEPYAFTVV